MNDSNQADTNTLFNQILIDIVSQIYSAVGPSDFSASLSGVLEFDDQQRVSKFINVNVNGLPKMPTPELTSAVNEKAQQIMELPQKYKLKSLSINVFPGGKIDVKPTYLVN